MMNLPSNDERRPATAAQFALRVAVLSGIALVAFAVIFFRLWYLQVLTGDDYVEQANNNRIRELSVPAPRGSITDRDGKVLVDNRTSLALQVRPDRLPAERKERDRVLDRVAKAAGIDRDGIDRRIRRKQRELPASPVTLSHDVPFDLVYYLQERGERFPGVSVERVFVRRYPNGTLGAHMLGYVSEVGADQLEEPRYSDLNPGDEIGQAGLESEYDHVLRGRNGALRVQVDAQGKPRGRRLGSREPEPGDNLVLSVDRDVQQAGEASLQSFGLPGAFVAMEVGSGAILGLGSFPTFDPAIYTKPTLSQSVIDQLYAEENEAPQADRAIQGLYPTGSTFKPITATAALEEGFLTPTQQIVDDGQVEIGDLTFKNAGNHPGYGSITLPRALQVSSDVFFYKLGIEAENAGDEPIQRWARELGLGGPTGIDLPSELGGLIPNPEWRNQLYKDGGTDRPWAIGDSINLSVGQGDLQANPLQMAVAYAALGNGGDIVRPHIAARVEDAAGRDLQEIKPAPRRHVDIAPENRQAILEGLRLAAMEPGGTSYQVFGGWPVDVAGKTGTAERGIGRADQSWYVALAPAENPKVVVAVTIERGGFGADAAAPAAEKILSQALNVKERRKKQVNAQNAPVE